MILHLRLDFYRVVNMYQLWIVRFFVIKYVPSNRQQLSCYGYQRLFSRLAHSETVVSELVAVTELVEVSLSLRRSLSLSKCW